VVEYIRYVLNHIFDLTQKATIYIELLFQLHTQSYAIASHLSCVVWVLKVMRACTCQMVSIAIASFFNKYYCILKNKSNDMRIKKIFLFQVLPDCKYFIYHPCLLEYSSHPSIIMHELEIYESWSNNNRILIEIKRFVGH
jgi:hypothetical protein